MTGMNLLRSCVAPCSSQATHVCRERREEERRADVSIGREKLVLRPYQEQAYVDLRRSVGRGHDSPVFVLPTGGGKTVIAAKLVDGAVSRGNEVLFLAPRRELVYQTSDKLDAVGVEHSIIMAGERRTIMPRVSVACIPSLHRRIADGRMEYPDAKLVIVDEAHLSIADTTRTILEHYREEGAKIIGLTATPCRSDGAGLGMIYDDLVLGPSIQDLTREGHLVPSRYFAGRAPNMEGVPTKGGDYNQKKSGERVNTVELVGDVVTNWLRLASDRQTFVFAVTVAHSRHLCDRFLDAGVRAEHLDGQTGREERKAILERLRTGETQVLCNCQVMTYGVDFPPTSCIVLARPTKSISMYLQMVGRGLRPSPGKTDCMVLDHAGTVDRLGFADEEIPWSLDGKEKVQDRIEDRERKDPDPIECHSCHAKIKPQRTCPYCGADLSKRAAEAIAAHDVELQEMDRKKRLKEGRQWTLEDKQRFYGELLTIAGENGYKPGWVANKYKAKLGVWPNQIGKGSIPSIDPSAETRSWVKSQQIRFAKGKAKNA